MSITAARGASVPVGRQTSAAPLPVVSEGWGPTLVTVDGKPAGGLARLSGQPAVLLESGNHVVAMAGPAPRKGGRS